MRYKVSSDDELTIKAKNTFVQLIRDKKLSELGI